MPITLKSRPQFAVLATFALLIAGCGQSGQAPTAPGGAAAPPTAYPTISEDAFPPGTRHDLATGIWQVTVAPDGTVAATGVRTAQLIGDNYTLDASGFLTDDPCFDCLAITGYTLIGNTLNIDVELKHPFPSAAVRADFDAFDPRVIVVAALNDEFGPMRFPGTPGVVLAAGEPAEVLEGNTQFLLNPHGYTTHFDRRVDDLLGVEWTGNLNPYRDFSEDLDPGPGLLPNPNHRFAQSILPETQTFQFTLPSDGLLEFALVLEVSWGQSTTKADRLSPTYYLPEFNRKEANAIEPNFLFGTAIERIYGAALPLQIEVADWQHGVAVDPIYPDPGNTSGLKQGSDVMSVLVEAPTLHTGAQTLAAPITGTGTVVDPLVYNVTLNRDRPVPPPPGPAPVLITVVDQMDGTELTPDPASIDLGFTQDVRAYQIIFLDAINEGYFQQLSPEYNQFSAGIQRGSPVFVGGPQPGADIAVYNDGDESSGIYIADTDNDILRLPLFYGREDGGIAVPTTVANGYTPLDDYPLAPHPAPGIAMAVSHIDASDNGSFAMTFRDGNFTFNPARVVGSGLTVELAEDSIVAFYSLEGGEYFASPRFISGRGSAGIPGTPLYGDRALLVYEGGEGYTSYTNPLGWISGGPATEGSGFTDSLTWYLYGPPFVSAGDRIFNGDLNPTIIDGTTQADWDNLVAADLGTIDRTVTPARQLMYTVTSTGKLSTLNVLASVGEGRVSDPVLIQQDDILTASPGSWVIQDLQVLEFDPANPRVANTYTQLGDWVAVLYNSTGLTPGGKIRIYEWSPGGPLVLVQELADNVGAEPYFSIMGMEVSALDVDDENYVLHVTQDDNGNSTDGGEIWFTLIGLL